MCRHRHPEGPAPVKQIPEKDPQQPAGKETEELKMKKTEKGTGENNAGMGIMGPPDQYRLDHPPEHHLLTHCSQKGYKEKIKQIGPPRRHHQKYFRQMFGTALQFPKHTLQT